MDKTFLDEQNLFNSKTLIIFKHFLVKTKDIS